MLEEGIEVPEFGRVDSIAVLQKDTPLRMISGRLCAVVGVVHCIT